MVQPNPWLLLHYSQNSLNISDKTCYSFLLDYGIDFTLNPEEPGVCNKGSGLWLFYFVKQLCSNTAMDTFGKTASDRSMSMLYCLTSQGTTKMQKYILFCWTLGWSSLLISRIDKDGSLSIDWREFRDFLQLTSCENLEDIVSFWRQSCVSDKPLDLSRYL